VYATAEAGLTGRALGAAELAAFKNHSSLSAECPAYMYVFHNSKEISTGAYTLGAVFWTTALLAFTPRTQHRQPSSW